jgi:hypothetical protein
MIQNLTHKKMNKISKYRNMETDFSRMWKVRTKIVPVIIEALGTTKISTFSFFQATSGHRTTEDHTNEHCTLLS